VGDQYCDTFVRGGLARVLEHTPEREARNLKTIVSPKVYKGGVHVWKFKFDNVEEPLLRVAYLHCSCPLEYRFEVGGRNLGYPNKGYAFGVLDSAKPVRK